MKKAAQLSILFAALWLTACGTKVPPPDPELAVAKSAISQAEGAGAYETAPVELKAAREKLNQARTAMQLEDHITARRLAEQAAVDANLALAKARTIKNQKAVEQIRESIRTLQEEIDRKSIR